MRVRGDCPRPRISGGSGVEFECGLPAARDKLLQRHATISDEGIAMREEEVLEVELVEEARVGSEQGALGIGRVVHQTVGNEAGRASLSTADYAVGECDGTLFGEVERCFIGADATYLTSQHATGQRVPWFEPFDGLAVAELVEAGAVAVHGAAERLDEAGAVAVVVAVREQDCLRAARALREPLEPTLRRHQRVDRHAGTIEPVGRHLDVDARVSRCPVKDAWKDLAHRRTIAPPRLAPGSARPPFGGGSPSCLLRAHDGDRRPVVVSRSTGIPATEPRTRPLLRRYAARCALLRNPIAQ